VRDVVARICKLLARDFTASTEIVGERLGQDAAYVIDSTRAREELGWRPSIGLDEGLEEVVAWVDRHWHEIGAQPLEYRHAA
jgi:dTDP-glucose 4,6-dehydratase